MPEQLTPPPNPDHIHHLPAPMPPVSLVLQRTESSLGLLREVVQESSADYWYKWGEAAMALEEWDKAVEFFQNCLLRDEKHRLAINSLKSALHNEVRLICGILKEKRTDSNYFHLRESKYDGRGYPVFDEKSWRDSNDNLFLKVIELYDKLAIIEDKHVQKSDVWVEAAQVFDGNPFRHPKLASACYCKAFSFNNRIGIYFSELRQSSYFQCWSNWPEGWSQERIMSLDAAIELFPDYCGTYWLRGERSFESKNYLEAAIDFETYYRLGGTEILWRYERQAQVYFKLNNNQKLQESLANLRRLGGDLVVKDGELTYPDDYVPF